MKIVTPLQTSIESTDNRLTPEDLTYIADRIATKLQDSVSDKVSAALYDNLKDDFIPEMSKKIVQVQNQLKRSLDTTPDHFNHYSPAPPASKKMSPPSYTPVSQTRPPPHLSPDCSLQNRSDHFIHPYPC